MKQKCPEFENHERWLVSYADMVTLLFAVFVVLYALTQAKLSKNTPAPTEAVAGSIQQSFNTPLEDIPVDRRVGPKEQGFGIFEHMRGNSVRPPLIEKYPNGERSVKIIESEMNQVKLKLEERLYGPNKHRDPGKTGRERVVDIQRTGNGFMLSLAARYFFPPGETFVQRGALKELQVVGEMMRELGRPITVEGHTDSLPSSGTYSNWELSALRASNVAKFFIRTLNFPPSKLSVAGYADTKPIASNNTESGRTLNRRIEIHVNYDGAGSSGSTP